MEDDKAALRRWALARRTTDDSPDLSGAIVARLATLPELQRAQNVLLYLAMPGEVNVEWVMGAFPAGAKRWFAPRCAPKRRLAIHPYAANETPLRLGPFGIREPDAGLVPEAEPEEMDAVIVPALRLTPDGKRLGYGGGYYDRLLPRLRPDCVTIGALPSALIVRELPQDPWDVLLHYVVTEATVFGSNRSA